MINKYAVLKQNLEGRIDEYDMYQINIDSLASAIEMCSPEDGEYKSQLEKLLADNKREQRKCKILLDGAKVIFDAIPEAERIEEPVAETPAEIPAE